MAGRLVVMLPNEYQPGTPTIDKFVHGVVDGSFKKNDFFIVSLLLLF